MAFPQTTPTLRDTPDANVEQNNPNYSEDDKAALRASAKLYLQNLYADGSNLSATQRFAITELIAKIDEETAAGPRPGISITNSVAAGIPYGLRTAFATRPVVTSSLTASGTHAVALTPYHITGSHTPNLFAAAPLPAGLVVDPATGIISGTPTTAGTTNTIVTVTNEGGSGTATVVFTIA